MFNISVLLDVQANLARNQPLIYLPKWLWWALFLIVLVMYNFGLVCDSRQCPAGHSLIMRPSSVYEAIWLNYALIYTKIPLAPLQSLARQSLFYGRIENSTITQPSCIFVELNWKEFLVENLKRKVLYLLSNVKRIWRFFFNLFLAFSEYRIF